jgi:hypothetical protein
MLPTAAQVLGRHRLVRLPGESPVHLARIRGDYFGYAKLSDGFLSSSTRASRLTCYRRCSADRWRVF